MYFVKITIQMNVLKHKSIHLNLFSSSKIYKIKKHSKILQTLIRTIHKSSCMHNENVIPL